MDSMRETSKNWAELDDATVVDAAPLEIEEEEEIVHDEVVDDEDEEEDEDDYDEQLEEEEEIPKPVVSFLRSLRNEIYEKNTSSLLYTYETKFNKINEKFYKKSEWPSVENVKNYIGEDELFLLLYRERAFHKSFMRNYKSTTFDFRVRSFDNYVELFEKLMKSEIIFELPNQWIFDIIEEFAYQFQDFWNQKMNKELTEKDKDILQKRPDAWSLDEVSKLLQFVTKESQIIEKLENCDQEEISRFVLNGEDHIKTMLGYYSLLGLSRIEILSGKFDEGLKVLKPIDMFSTKRGSQLFNRVISCNISLSYFTAYALLMKRRYLDAIRILRNMFSFLFRSKSYGKDPERIIKKCDKSLNLLSILMALHTQRIDDNIRALLKDRCNDNLSQMQKGDLETFKKVYKQSTPKLLSTGEEDVTERELRNFEKDTKEQLEYLKIINIMKKYSLLSTSKLAKLANLEQRNANTILDGFKDKMYQNVHNGNNPFETEPKLSGSVSFEVKNDVIHITEKKNTKNYVDYLERQVQKYAEIYNELRD